MTDEADPVQEEDANLANDGEENLNDADGEG